MRCMKYSCSTTTRPAAHLYVSSVVVGVFDVRKPVSGRFGKVLRLCDKPQQLGPTCERRLFTFIIKNQDEKRLCCHNKEKELQQIR